MTKKSQVLNYLQNHKKITSWEAIQMFKATRLSAIIYELKKEYNIETVMQDGMTDEGRAYQYAVYCYLGQKNFEKLYKDAHGR